MATLYFCRVRRQKLLLFKRSYFCSREATSFQQNLLLVHRSYLYFCFGTEGIFAPRAPSLLKNGITPAALGGQESHWELTSVHTGSAFLTQRHLIRSNTWPLLLGGIRFCVVGVEEGRGEALRAALFSPQRPLLPKFFPSGQRMARPRPPHKD